MRNGKKKERNVTGMKRKRRRGGCNEILRECVKGEGGAKMGRQ